VATASDHKTVAILTANNAKLLLQLKTSQACVQKLKEDIEQLKLKLKPAWQGQRTPKMTNNDNYFWSHGYQVHNGHTSASCKNQRECHRTEVTKANPMGGVKWGKEWCGGAAKVLDHKIDQLALTLDCIPPTSTVAMNDTAILYSGCTSIFLSAIAPCMNIRTAHVPLHVNMPKGTTIQSSHTSELLLSAFPAEARQAHILPGLVHNSLISAWKLCDSGCDITFTQEKVEVNKNGKSVMSGVRDQKSRLWRVTLQ
jgi:hypothetical protein